jgi:hypothetical protein
LVLRNVENANLQKAVRILLLMGEFGREMGITQLADDLGSN